MEKAKWHIRWMANHPQATLQEYSDALAHHTLLMSALVYAAGTAAFLSKNTAWERKIIKIFSRSRQGTKNSVGFVLD